MKLQELGLEELKSNELTEIQGGGWLDFILGYIVGEVLEGIQRGISKPCVVQCCLH